MQWLLAKALDQYLSFSELNSTESLELVENCFSCFENEITKNSIL